MNMIVVRMFYIKLIAAVLSISYPLQAFAKDSSTCIPSANWLCQEQQEAVEGLPRAKAEAIIKCTITRIEGATFREFTQTGGARCPGGGCFLESNSCNRREANLRYHAPTDYVIDDYKFVQTSNNHGTTSDLIAERDGGSRVIGISIRLICDPPDYLGAPGGWNFGELKGRLRHTNVAALKARAIDGCKVQNGVIN